MQSNRKTTRFSVIVRTKQSNFWMNERIRTVSAILQRNVSSDVLKKASQLVQNLKQKIRSSIYTCGYTDQACIFETRESILNRLDLSLWMSISANFARCYINGADVWLQCIILQWQNASTNRPWKTSSDRSVWTPSAAAIKATAAWTTTTHRDTERSSVNSECEIIATVHTHFTPPCRSTLSFQPHRLPSPPRCQPSFIRNFTV